MQAFLQRREEDFLHLQPMHCLGQAFLLAVGFTGILLYLPRLIIWLYVEDSKDHSMDFLDHEQCELDLDASGCLSDFWPSTTTSKQLGVSSPYSSRNRRLLSSSPRPSFFDYTYQCVKFNRLAANSYRKSAFCKPALSTIYEEPLRFDGA